MLVGLLHTRSAAAVYEKLGWSRLKAFSAQVKGSELLKWSESKSDRFVVSVWGEKEIESNLKELADIYQSFSSRFFGPTARSFQYWQKWVLSNLKLYRGKWACAAAHDKSGKLLAYIFVSPAPQMTVVSEFGMIGDNDSAAELFGRLLSCVSAQPLKDSTVTVPLPVFQTVFSSPPAFSVISDDGWYFYNPWKNDASNNEAAARLQAKLEKMNSPKESLFLFWAGDAF